MCMRHGRKRSCVHICVFKFLFLYTCKPQQMYDLAFALALWLWGLQRLCLSIFCGSELCHCEQLGMQCRSLRQEVLSRPPLASWRVLSIFCFPRSEVFIFLPPRVLLHLLRNSVGPIASLNDVLGLYQLFPFFPLCLFLWLFVMFIAYLCLLFKK